MAKFTIKRKGYSVDEVDEFITKLLSLTESKLEEQSKRINELKEQVRSLTAEKEEFKAKECSVSGALTEAVKRADEIQSMSETRYSLELQRIKNFRKRAAARKGARKHLFTDRLCDHGFPPCRLLWHKYTINPRKSKPSEHIRHFCDSDIFPQTPCTGTPPACRI